MNDMLAMLDELLTDDSDQLTAWEIEFIESLNKQRDREWSQRQEDVLIKIWEKIFG